MTTSHSRLHLGVVDPGVRVLVLGYAREGRSVASFLAARGAQVTVADAKVASFGPAPETDEDFALSPEDLNLLDTTDAVVVSPGIPDGNPLISEARRRDIQIASPTQIFFSLCPCPIIGITGSSGKSTTTALVAAILRAADYHVGLGGNIGRPMLDLLPELSLASFAVVELSSFQLDLLQRSPHIAVVTNLTPNHLDRHGDMEHYIAAKRNILKFQSPTDIAILNAADPITRLMGVESNSRLIWFRIQDSNQPGVYVKDGNVQARIGEQSRDVVGVNKIPIPGRHNVENVLAAVAVGAVMNIPAEIIRQAVMSFQGLDHRLQKVAEIGGVTYIDDSIATSPERAARGIESFDAPVVLIAGGRSKHLPWEPVLTAMRDRVVSVVVVGEASEEIAAAIKDGPSGREMMVLRASSLPHAIALARDQAQPGSVVLLSPGCTSFDMYADFEERGRSFTEEVLHPSWQS